MKAFSLFSGIGGFDLALKRNGVEIVGACEIDKYARQVYGKHFPGVKIHENATTIEPKEIPNHSIFVAGFPCQSFSIAGNRRGFNDTRGTLFFEIHKIISENLEMSPMYSGAIKSMGARYCPSIEDKVVKFPDKTSHNIFLEPEGLDTDWIYPNGISTSLDEEVQKQLVRTIPGLEEAEIVLPGYAVEYDFVPPTQLTPSLETKRVSGLFHAGQINGTSGYEEAACQGLMAGINAALKSQKRKPFLPVSYTHLTLPTSDLV